MILIRLKALCKIFVILTAIFMFARSVSAQQYWVEQQCPTTKSLQHLMFTDSLNGWASGDSGAIVHTSNGGQNWSVQQSGIIISIDDIFFANSRLGWALSNDFYYGGTIILKTTNAGVNWTNSRYPDTTILIRSVFFIDSANGFLGGTGFTYPVILRTSNGGINWQQCLIDSGMCYNFPVLRINFINQLTGFACGGYNDRAGIYWKTTNGGLSWKDSCISPEPLFDIILINNYRIVATGGDPEFGSSNYSSTDGGSTWKPTSLQIFGIPKRIAGRTLNEYWIPCGYAEKFAVSIDTTKSWFQVDTPDSANLFDIRFVNQLNGWCIGNKGQNQVGAIFKYNTAVIGIQPQQSTIPEIPVLYQNYPNPFNPSTMIRFYLPSGSSVVITVYDIIGRTIKVFNKGILAEGEHSIEFDAHELPSGVYFYQLRAVNKEREFVENKKMVLIK
jgi:photosystem II stability/assembly factor-like uncharacterized protein